MELRPREAKLMSKVSPVCGSLRFVSALYLIKRRTTSSSPQSHARKRGESPWPFGTFTEAALWTKACTRSLSPSLTACIKAVPPPSAGTGKSWSDPMPNKMIIKSLRRSRVALLSSVSPEASARLASAPPSKTKRRAISDQTSYLDVRSAPTMILEECGSKRRRMSNVRESAERDLWSTFAMEALLLRSRPTTCACSCSVARIAAVMPTASCKSGSAQYSSNFVQACM
mmetsp:Transcript_39917/g.127939  ORF Transcript_39917/g.127939 Transcript_39917/m.127939 type:complete len:228 (-) Transcript_39917:639-1322(-)